MDGFRAARSHPTGWCEASHGRADARTCRLPKADAAPGERRDGPGCTLLRLDRGGVPEWPKGTVLKTVVRETVPGVRIPPPPILRRGGTVELRSAVVALTRPSRTRPCHPARKLQTHPLIRHQVRTDPTNLGQPATDILTLRKEHGTRHVPRPPTRHRRQRKPDCLRTRNAPSHRDCGQPIAQHERRRTRRICDLHTEAVELGRIPAHAVKHGLHHLPVTRHLRRRHQQGTRRQVL